MRAAVVLFTRDLRVHDNPALSAAAEQANLVVPLFVFDDEILRSCASANRLSFLLDSLADLDRALRELGSSLTVRRGDVVAECLAVTRDAHAEAVFISEDVSAYAQAREERLRRALTESRVDLNVYPGVTVVPPADLPTRGGGDRYVVFTPYWNRWRDTPRRSVLESPKRLRSPSIAADGLLPSIDELAPLRTTADLPHGGETEGRRRLERFIRNGLQNYDERRDDLAQDATSGLSPYIHFGCVSPLEVAERAGRAPGGDPFARQLCWRDFHYQLHAADPSISNRDLRHRGDRWRDDTEALQAWKEGHTGYPIVDAGMRQLLAEGTMHNRARLVTASFLTKHLYLDWRLGAAHFARHLADGDVVSNAGNWQWVAGTGADTRPNRVLNPIRQARRFDPQGDYVRRWVPELASAGGANVHEPWRLPTSSRGTYPQPIVEHDAAVARFGAARATSATSRSG